MTAVTTIDGYLATGRARRRLSRARTPVETPTVGAVPEPAAPEEFSESRFIAFAEKDPTKLVELIQSGVLVRPSLLTFAAEAAGRIANSSLVVVALLPLLGHADPVVREGAVYGLEPHLETSLVARDTLRQMRDTDPSPGVKAAVAEALALVE